MADKPNNNGEIGKIDPKHIGIRRATADDLPDLYRFLEEFYVNIRIGGEEFCKAYYAPPNMHEMVKKKSMILYTPKEIIAAFTLSGLPFMGTTGWDEPNAMYLEGVAISVDQPFTITAIAPDPDSDIKPDMQNRGMEKNLFDRIERVVLNTDRSLIRVAAINWLTEFYKGNGFNRVGERPFRDIYNLVLMEKKLK